MSIKRQRLIGLGLLAAFGFAGWLQGGEKSVIHDERLFPKETLLALVIPDLEQARTAAARTRLGQMFGAPEMQAFLSPALAEMKKIFDEQRKANAMIPPWENIDQALLSGGLAVGLYLRPNDPKAPMGMILSFRPKTMKALQDSLPPQMRPMLAGDQPVPLGANPHDPVLLPGKDRLVVVLPQGDLPDLNARLGSTEAKPVGSLLAEGGYVNTSGTLKNASGWIYFAPQKMVDGLLAQKELGMGAREVAIATTVIKASGLNQLQHVAMGLGFSNTDPVFEAVARFDGQPRRGLFSIIGSEPQLNAGDFQIAEKDAPFVTSTRFNFEAVFPLIRRVANSIDPNFNAMIQGVLAGINAQLGVDLEKDVLAQLNNQIVTAQTVVDTSAPLSFAPGMVSSIGLKDPEKIKAFLPKLNGLFQGLMAQFQAMSGQELGGLSVNSVKEIPYKSHKLYYFSGMVMPGLGAVSVVGNRFLFGTSLNALRHGIDQLERKSSILDNPDFQASIQRLTGKPFAASALPSSVSYSIDQGSGTGSLIISGLALAAGTAQLAGLAELPGRMGAGGVAPGNVPANETAAMAACMAYAEAQDIYRRTDWDEDGVLEYAQALKGDNSLLEKTAGQADLMLITKNMAAAEGEAGGQAHDMGYRYKVLKGQGKNPPGGAKTYVQKGNMTLGYALLAYPAAYGVTGKMTYQLNNTGTLYAKDMGAGTDALVKTFTVYDPDATWVVVDPFGDDGGPGLGADNPVDDFLQRPSGKVLMRMATAIDLGLWPDAGFFKKFQRPMGALSVQTNDGIYVLSELPFPGPSSRGGGVDVMTATAGIAVVAAIAIPNLLRSRMAANEGAATSACKMYAEAQDIYRRTDWDGDGTLEYAQVIKGDHSLFETKAGQGDTALVDRAFAMASDEKNPVPKAGYYYRVLKGQGPSAPGGKKSYLSRGNMTLGYALIAYPAKYDGTGRNTFIINNTGTLYQRDLGNETEVEVQKMIEGGYDPDQHWVVAE